MWASLALVTVFLAGKIVSTNNSSFRYYISPEINSHSINSVFLLPSVVFQGTGLEVLIFCTFSATFFLAACTVSLCRRPRNVNISTPQISPTPSPNVIEHIQQIDQMDQIDAQVTSCNLSEMESNAIHTSQSTISVISDCSYRIHRK